MDIKPPNLPANLSPANIKAELSQWRTGQILDATISKHAKPDQVLIKAGSQTLQAPNKTPEQFAAQLTQGIKVKLEVLQITPQLMFKVTPTPPAGPNATADALKQFLPKQTSLTPLLANLAALNKPSTTPALPHSLSNSIAQLIKQLPNVQQMLKGDGGTLKQAIRESGSFLESTLTQSASQQDKGSDNSLQRDFKANVLKVLQQLQTHQHKQASSPSTTTQNNTPQGKESLLQTKPPSLSSPLPTPAAGRLASTVNPTLMSPTNPSTMPQQTTPSLPAQYATIQAQARSKPSVSQQTPLTMILTELSQQIEGVLSRIRVNQLLNVPVENTPQQQWTVELPIRRNDGFDLIHLRIEEDETSPDHNSNNKKKVWKVTLAFDLDELGPLYANITVCEQNVSATLHAEEQKTAAMIDDHLASLSESLSDAGLKVDTLACHQGKPAQQPKNRLYQSLLDLKV